MKNLSSQISTNKQSNFKIDIYVNRIFSIEESQMEKKPT